MFHKMFKNKELSPTRIPDPKLAFYPSQHYILYVLFSIYYSGFLSNFKWSLRWHFLQTLISYVNKCINGIWHLGQNSKPAFFLEVKIHSQNSIFVLYVMYSCTSSNPNSFLLIFSKIGLKMETKPNSNFRMINVWVEL